MITKTFLFSFLEKIFHVLQYQRLSEGQQRSGMLIHCRQNLLVGLILEIMAGGANPFYFYFLHFYTRKTLNLHAVLHVLNKPEVYLEPYRKSTMELFAKIVKG